MSLQTIKELVQIGMRLCSGHTYSDVEDMIDHRASAMQYLLVKRGFRHPTADGVHYKPGQVISTRSSVLTKLIAHTELADVIDQPPGGVQVYPLTL